MRGRASFTREYPTIIPIHSPRHTGTIPALPILMVTPQVPIHRLPAPAQPPPCPSPNMRNRQPWAEMSTAMWGICAMPSCPMPSYAGWHVPHTINGATQVKRQQPCMVTVQLRPSLVSKEGPKRVPGSIKFIFHQCLWSILRLNGLHEAKVFYLAQSWWDTVVNRVSANLLDKKHV